MNDPALIPQDFKYRSVLLRGKPSHGKYDSFRIRHPLMSTARRAKIFAPFDALAGFDEAIAGKEIRYEKKRQLSEEALALLDQQITLLRTLTQKSRRNAYPPAAATVFYYVPCTDPCHEAFQIMGRYENYSGIVHRVDIYQRLLLIGDRKIPLDDICTITPECRPDTVFSKAAHSSTASRRFRPFQMPSGDISGR